MTDKKGDRFSFEEYKKILELAKSKNYHIFSCKEYYNSINNLPEKYIILRHDIEHYPERAFRFAEIESNLGIHSTFFVRIHSNSYNVFGHKSQYFLKKIKSEGHEIGLHTEAVDFSKITGQETIKVFEEEIMLLEKAVDSKIVGVCPHVDWTEYNNQDIFDEIDIKEYDLKYNAYAKEFFVDNFYISDGQHYFWKNYKNGEQTENTLDPIEAINQGINKIYILTHPMNWFDTEYHVMF